MHYFGIIMVLTFYTEFLQKILKTWTSLLAMLFDSKMPASLGSQDLLQNTNAVTTLKPKGHPL